MSDPGTSGDDVPAPTLNTVQGITMTYPNQPQYPPQQPVQQPQPGYFPQQAPPQGYPPQQQQGYYPPPPQGYAPPPPPPAQHLNASIDDFYDQPAASGKSIASWFQTPGQAITGMVARPISKADLRPQTDMQSKQPKFFSDGRPMLTMTIPLTVAPSPDFPDGRAAWIISSSDREDLDVAMQAAGCSARTVPEAGALITITFVGFKQIPGFGAPKKVKSIKYTRPQGAEVTQPPPPAAGAPFNGGQQYADPSGQAAQDMVTGNGNGQALPPMGNVPTGQYAPQSLATGQPTIPNGNGNVPNGQYAPGTQYAPPPPGPQQNYGGPTQTSVQGQPQQYAQGQQAGQVPAPPAQQWAAPADLTAEQATRLRELTGN